MSSAPYVVYEPMNGLAMVQWIECKTKVIAELENLRNPEISSKNIQQTRKNVEYWGGRENDRMNWCLK